MKTAIKRLATLEIAAQTKVAKQADLARNMYVSIDDNVAIVIGTKAEKMISSTAYGVITQLQAYIHRVKPKCIHISANVSNVCDLFPGEVTTEAREELGSYFVISYLSISGDFYKLLSDGVATLQNIILCGCLYPYFRRSLSNEAMGFSYPDFSIETYSNRPIEIVNLMLDYVSKCKEYRTACEANPTRYRGEPRPIIPASYREGGK